MNHKYYLFACLICVGCASASIGATHTDAEEVQCLSLAIYFEARGESDVGQLAVGSVVLNRAKDSNFPSTVCGVVKQGGESPPCQFSWWCDGKSDQPREASGWLASQKLANKILRGEAIDPTRGALYFHTTAVNPKWRLQRLGKIGSHIFYR